MVQYSSMERNTPNITIEYIMKEYNDAFSGIGTLQGMGTTSG